MKEVVCNLVTIGRCVALRKKISFLVLDESPMEFPQTSSRCGSWTLPFGNSLVLVLIFQQGCSAYVTLAEELL